MSAAKYVAVAAIAVRHGLAHRAVLWLRASFYVVLLFVFSRLWRVVAASGTAPGTRASDMIWYLAATEWVVLGAPTPHRDVERDVRSGDIAYGLPRPLSYVGWKVAENVGSLVVRLLALGVTGFLTAWALSGDLPSNPGSLALIVPLGFLAGVVMTVFAVAVGVSAFWLQDATPIAWVWQKCLFVLGGLILPLSIYPAWLRRVAAWTPFPWLVNGPGRTALGLEPSEAFEIVGFLLLWGAVGTLLLTVLYRRGLRALDVNGG